MTDIEPLPGRRRNWGRNSPRGLAAERRHTVRNDSGCHSEESRPVEARRLEADARGRQMLRFWMPGLFRAVQRQALEHGSALQPLVLLEGSRPRFHGAAAGPDL